MAGVSCFFISSGRAEVVDNSTGIVLAHTHTTTFLPIGFDLIATRSYCSRLGALPDSTALISIASGMQLSARPPVRCELQRSAVKADRTSRLNKLGSGQSRPAAGKLDRKVRRSASQPVLTSSAGRMTVAALVICSTYHLLPTF